MSLQSRFQKETVTQCPVSLQPLSRRRLTQYSLSLQHLSRRRLQTSTAFFCFSSAEMKELCTFPSDTFQFIFNWQVVKVKCSESELQALNTQKCRPVLFFCFTKSPLSENRVPLPKEFSVFWPLQSAHLTSGYKTFRFTPGVLPLVIAKHLGTFNYYKHSTCCLPGLIADVGTANHVL